MKEFDKRQSLLEAREEVFQEQINEDESSLFAQELVEPEKRERYSKIKDFLFNDWQKDLKKLQTLFMWFFYAAVVFAMVFLSFGKSLGWKMDFFVDKVNYKNYNHIAPDLTFEYPTYFAIDNGEGKNYGETYLAGLKLSTDPRTGCDVRLSAAGLNFQKSDTEIAKALVSEISKTAKDFKLISARRIKIDGENAFSLEFSFTDPINSRVRLNQIVTGHGGQYYMIICGTGDYQYKYFESDFQNFLDSFQWQSSLQS